MTINVLNVLEGTFYKMDCAQLVIQVAQNTILKQVNV